MVLGIYKECVFPQTGVNCTEIVSDKVTPTLDYVIIIGMVECSLLTIPVMYTAYVTRSALLASQNKSLLSGCGVRYVCALSLLIGQFASMAWLLTGLNMVHPASGALGVLSFAANGATILSFHVSVGCVILLARMIFFLDIENTPMSKSLAALQKVDERLLMVAFIGPTAAAYLVAFILASAGLVVDNISLVRIAMGGCTVSCAVLYALSYTLAWPAIRTLKAMTEDKSGEAGESWKSSGNAEFVAKVTSMSTKLSALLKSQDTQCVVLGSIFAFFSLSNVLHIPEFFMGVFLYDLTFLLPLHTVMTLALLHKKKNKEKNQVSPSKKNIFDEVSDATEGKTTNLSS